MDDPQPLGATRKMAKRTKGGPGGTPMPSLPGRPVRPGYGRADPLVQPPGETGERDRDAEILGDYNKYNG